ncbi:MAG TPA: cytochrome P450 [Terriglobia bacterium]|nr:cytochrome P450 [Terriglobia bacterium]
MSQAPSVTPHPPTDNAKSRTVPPGPKPKLLLGHSPWTGDDPLRTLTNWAREYGDVVYFRRFHYHVYFLNRPDLIEQVLVTDQRNFIKGRGLQANRRLFGNGLLTSEGDYWFRQRRLMQPAFHRERIAAYGKAMVASAARMIETWRDGECRDVHEDMMRLALEIVAKTLFSTEVEADVERVGATLSVLMKENRSARILLPFFRMLPTPGNLRYRTAVHQLDEIIYRIIREHRARDRDTGDLLSMLLRARDEDGRRMTDTQLRDEAMTLFLAGHETTALALSWTWYLLARYPDVERKLQTELREVLGGRAPAVDDLPRLPYTERVIKESMRLYSPAYVIARIALSDCDISGYHVPRGASLVMSQWVMHRDPRYWDDPERFNPDRWTPEFEARLPRFVYFPFGGGPRVCIGASFALMEAALLLATIAQRFTLTLVPEHPVEPFPSITLRPKNGIKVVLSAR